VIEYNFFDSALSFCAKNDLSEKTNEITDIEIKYEPESASGCDKIMIIAELQLLDPDVQKMALDILTVGL
jgi:hypothetical protein